MGNMRLFILSFIITLLCGNVSPNLLLDIVNETFHWFQGNSRPTRSQGSENVDCNVDNITPIPKFDMDKFKGDWFVTHRMIGGYNDLNNGMWRFYPQAENYYGFYFQGRNKESDCIRPYSGRIEQKIPGAIDLIYRTYSFKVRERINVIYTNYNDTAVIYSCQYTFPSGKCHPAGLHVEIWSRNKNHENFIGKEILEVLQKVCVNVKSVIPQEAKDQCDMDEIYGGGDPYQKPAPDICYLPPKIGSCKGSILRYFFNPKSGKCERFTFGGCYGNFNNFLSHDDCQKTCINMNSDPLCKTEATCGITCPPCCQEDYSGCLTCDCEDVIVDIPYPCIESTHQCPPHCIKIEITEGCDQCQCEEDLIKIDNICTKPADKGDCKGSFVKFFYKPSSEKCEEFTYGGCGGNENNFDTEEECNKICQDVLPATRQPFQVECLQPLKEGICRGRKQRYFYNAKTGLCKMFYYSGCGGNKNNFHTEALCYHTCNGTLASSYKVELVKDGNPDHAVFVSCLPTLLISMFSVIVIYNELF